MIINTLKCYASHEVQVQINLNVNYPLAQLVATSFSTVYRRFESLRVNHSQINAFRR